MSDTTIPAPEPERVAEFLADVTELLRQHLVDWGYCDKPYTCSCSHARALRYLEWLPAEMAWLAWQYGAEVAS